MSEFVKDYRESFEEKEKEKGNKPTERDTLQPPDALLPDTLNSDNSQQLQNQDRILPIDKSSFERRLEQELFGANYNPVDCAPANDIGGDASAGQTISDDPPESETDTHKIVSAYFDLIKEERQEQPVPVAEEPDDNLVGVLARSLNGRNQPAAPEFAEPKLEEKPETDYSQEQPAYPYSQQKVQRTGFWTWRVTLGSAAMLGVIAVGGVFVKTYDFPSVIEGIAQVTNLVKQQSSVAPAKETIATSSLAETDANTGTLLAADFFTPPSPAASTVKKSQKIIVDRIEISTSEEPPEIRQVNPVKLASTGLPVNTLDSLNGKVKAVRLLLSSLQGAYNNASPEKMPGLLKEITKVQGVIAALESKITVLVPSQASAQKTETRETTAPVNDGSQEIIAERQKKTSENTRIAILRPKTTTLAPKPSTLAPKLPKSREPREPKAVEIALASTPGLYPLEPLRRQRLKTKLINGDCLVPALSSVFSQIPVLVMRDMVRQLNDQC